MNIEKVLNDKSTLINQAYGRYKEVNTRVDLLSSEIKELQEKSISLDKAVAFISRFADQREDSVYRFIEDIVSKGLTDVFEEELKLIIVQKMVGKRLELKFRLVSVYGDEQVETDILSARGGGVAAVTGFLLRVVIILLLSGSEGVSRFIALDEAFGQVSSNYVSNVAALLRGLADEYGIQFILVTHDASGAYESVSDVVYRASATNGETKFSRV